MVDIVIVNWNSGDYLSKCIDSVFSKLNEEIVGQVFIIDNNSTDDSLEKIGTRDKMVIVRNTENKGFSKACNQGFKLCSASYILLLNPDTQLHNTTLKDCITFMDNHNDVAILGCQLLNDEGTITVSCTRFPTPVRYFYDAIGLSKLAPKVFVPALLMTDWDHTTSRHIDQVMGAFMFMRSSIFKKSGYFDERFFVYYEDLDFSKRVALAGGHSYFDFNIKATHSGGGTTENVKAFRLFLNLKSRLQYAKKYFSFPGYISVWLCTFCIEPITRNVLLLFQGKLNEMKQVIKGYILLITHKNQ